jgi:N6-L-threonylcarbamoyladenine synthase
MTEEYKADIAASFTEALVKSICVRVEALFDQYGACPLVLAGGVAANSHLRSGLKALTDKKGVSLYLPPLSLCGDNAAMIASQGYFEYISGSVAGLDLNAYATKIV